MTDRKSSYKAPRPVIFLLTIRAMAVVLIAVLFLTRTPEKIMYPKLHWDKVEQYADAFGIDPYLVMALIKVESNYRPSAVSKSGAIGLMQIMPDTGAWAAQMLGAGSYYDDRLKEPDFNIMIGSWYMAHMLSLYNDPTVAVAAYNAGRGNVDRWLADGTWSGAAEAASDVPYKETREFIKKVMRAWEMYSDIYGPVGGLIH